MEKIVVIINAHKPDLGLVDFACRIATLSKTKLTGLFIDTIYYSPTPPNRERLSLHLIHDDESTAATVTDTDQALNLFKQTCYKKGVTEHVYVDKGEPIQQVLQESRFADLLIVDPEINFYDHKEQPPSHFVKEILSHAACPVLLAPQKMHELEEIVFCYDGSASSIFAIKQFTYLFPELQNRKSILLEINKKGIPVFDESHYRLMDWLKTHFTSVQYECLEGTAKERLFPYFFMKKNKLIVMGAYGRGLLSTLFKRSSLDTLVRTVDLPIFITHD